jgi:hypothetical protein
MTKLTLSMDEEVVATAKRIARRHRQSVSAMLSNVVKAMAASEEGRDMAVPADSVAAQATGLIKLPPGRTADDLRYDALRDKYGLTPE